VVAAVGGLVGIAASLRDPAQSWLTDSQRFSRLEERLRPITAPAEKLHRATEQLEKATAPRDGPPMQKVEVTRPGLSASSQLAVDTRRLRSLPSSATLSPVAVFVMIIVLGWMWGVIGALVALPVLASLKIICDRIGSLHPIAEFLSP
jgi:hypothetical protein